MRSSNLRPQQIVDKNGVVTTRHVRAEGKPVGSSSLASVAPKLPSKATQPKVPKSALKERYEMLYINNVSDELTIFTEKNHSHTYTAYRMTDEQYFSVYSVTSVSDAFVLVSAGIRTQEGALSYLHKNGFEHLIEDNSEVSKTLLEKGISATEFIRVHSRSDNKVELTPTLVDALKIQSMKSYEDLGVHNEVRLGLIDYEDLRAVGATRIKVFDEPSTIDRLCKIKKNEVPYTAKELAKMIDKLHPKNNPLIGNGILESALDMADVAGSRIILDDAPWQLTRKCFYQLSSMFRDKDTLKEALYYTNSVMPSARRNVVNTMGFGKVMGDLFKAGTSVDVASRVAKGEITPEQALAITQGEVSSSLSSGWL